MTQEQIEYSNKKFSQKSECERQAIDNLQRVILINKYLENFNWVIFNPYLPGYIINHFEDLQKAGSKDKEKVFQVFSHFFFDLKQTAFFIDGYFKRRPFLAPFCQIIDQSVFMCLQKDYAGAIAALIPVIEGAIRLYLNSRTNERLITVKQKQLIEAFVLVENDFKAAVTAHYAREYSTLGNEGICFSNEQIDVLVTYRCRFFNIWVTPLKNYIDKNFYFEFNKGTPKDNLSRNVIMHGYNSEVYYTLENYLKIFNCIVYMSYVFGMPDPTSNTLIELSVNDIAYKWRAFEKIRAISETMTDIKASVYQTYTSFDENEFREKFVVNEMEDIFSKVSKKNIENKLKSIDFFFDEIVLKR